MNRRHWRETVEIVGVVSIVAALLFVAWEIDRGRQVAAVDVELRLAQGIAEIHAARATTPDFARLFPKLGSPEGHLITATEASQIKGLVLHLVDVYRSAQIAHDRGLLDDTRLSGYVQDLAGMLNRYPGLVPYFVALHDTDPDVRTMPVFRPVRDVREQRPAAGAND